MRVTYSRRLIDKFKAEAKRIYPKEAFAVLLGKRAGEMVRIDQLYIPDAQERLCTATCVPRADLWLNQARLLAATIGVDVLGEIHSHSEDHTFKHDVAPSEDDWTRAGQLESATHGVCSLRKYPSGRMSARVRFWPSRLGIAERVTE